jgi:hypothetical protein
MQALLSYDRSPPLGAPLRFFLTAPVFGILAGLLMLWSGESIFASRWSPSTLALTHLITAGFMLQVMLGAMIQIMPVVAGANMAKPNRLAGTVHASLTIGMLFLTAAFLSFSPHMFKIAALFFTVGVACFLVAAFHAFRGVPSTSTTVLGLKHALVGLGLTVAFGVGLAVALGWAFSVPLMQLADIHAGWGFAAWGAILLAAVAYVVVPMFQLTPAYPAWFDRRFSWAVLVIAVFWTLTVLAGFERLAVVLAFVLVLGCATFAVVTLKVQYHSKRPNFDVTQHYWRVAMASALAACGVWVAAQATAVVGDWPGWTQLFGVLLLAGGFMSVIVGMLYKIVPFLVWLHLQNLGLGIAQAPNMKKIIAEKSMRDQMRVQFVGLALLVLAVFWPEWFVYPAGLVLVSANVWLLRNMLAAVAVYRSHVLKIEAAG